MTWTIPNTFATQSGNVPVSQIDTNFTYVSTGIQTNLAIYALDTGSLNAYAANYTPTPSLVDGMGFWFKASSTNTGPCTFNINGLGALSIQTNTSASLNAGLISTNQDVFVMYNSSLNGGAGGWMAPFLANLTVVPSTIPALVNMLDTQYLGGF